MTERDAATAQAWRALGGTADSVERLAFRGAGAVLPARLPVRQLARATVGACSLAAAELLGRRGGVPAPTVEVREDAVAAAFVSERLLRIDDRAMTTFAPLSGFWPATDGWVRTHANYPHHRARLLAALGIRDTGDDVRLALRLADEIGTRGAEETQESAYAAGALAVAVAREPAARVPVLVESGRGASAGGRRRLGPARLPAAGVRVLDLTRVTAGPVATRTLALLGADVLRVDSPRLPEDPDTHADTGTGKRSTLLDLADRRDAATFTELLASADVVVTGYRPGSLAARGLDARDLAERRPGLVAAEVCAWDRSGRWAGRRGFDSLVQAGTGIAAIEAGRDGRPGVLPAQALDHGTGYLIAAGVLRALTERQSDGAGRWLRYSLAATASWLLHDLRPEPPLPGRYDRASRLAERPSVYGRLRYARPAVAYAGGPADWAEAPTRWGGDPAAWRR